MPATIQIRNVPDGLHRQLKSRAALAGKSLSEYLLGEIRAVAQRPTNEDILERLRKLPPIDPGVEPAEIIRDYRDRYAPT